MILASANFGLTYWLEIVGLLLVLWVIIFKFPGPWLKQMMDRRREQIGRDLSAGEEAEHEAERVIAQSQAELEAAREEAQMIREQARRSAELIRAEGNTRAEEEYNRLIHRADSEIETARHRVEAGVLDELAGTIVAATEAVVVAELNATLQRRLIEESLIAAEHEAAAS